MINPNFKCRQMATTRAICTTGSQAALPPPAPSPLSGFTTDLYNVFNLKLNIFNDLCTKAGVTTEHYPAAFGTMLQGKAQTYYYQHLASKRLTFLKLCDRTQAYFHTAKNHQHFLNKWRSIMLWDIITANPDKSLP
ncbi:hypothetical protein EK21DRAFT_113704 [Setomelanomma holmii]|uniref:Uncharacterized protein n=1 Tax=Setomelanomma holmii TaxID=210430 RepID=A0A9P4H8E8_9PLEO|nr:hypothetical protein EK21DRAFT_113704 [Setomelanomma holmii]